MLDIPPQTTPEKCPKWPYVPMPLIPANGYGAGSRHRQGIPRFARDPARHVRFCDRPNRYTSSAAHEEVGHRRGGWHQTVGFIRIETRKLSGTALCPREQAECVHRRSVTTTGPTADRICGLRARKAAAAPTAVLGPGGPARRSWLATGLAAVLLSRPRKAAEAVTNPASWRPFPCRSPRS